MKQIIVFGTAALVAVVVTGFTTWATYGLFPLMWRHVEIVTDMNYWSVPFAILVALVAAAWPIPPTSGHLRRIIAVLIGAALAFAYPLFAFRYTPLFGCCPTSMLAQVITCWVAAGVSAMLTIALRRARSKVAAIASLCLLAIMVPRPAFNALVHNQELTVAFVVRSTDQEGVRANSDIRIDETEAASLRKRALGSIRGLAGQNGNYRVASLWRTGEGAKALAVIVIPDQVRQKVRLRQPEGTTVVYVQGATGWLRLPPGAPTLARYIVVGPPTTGNGVISFDIDDAEGVMTSGRVF